MEYTGELKETFNYVDSLIVESTGKNYIDRLNICEVVFLIEKLMNTVAYCEDFTVTCDCDIQAVRDVVDHILALVEELYDHKQTLLKDSKDNITIGVHSVMDTTTGN